MYGFVMQVRYGNVAYCGVWLCKAVMVGYGTVRLYLVMYGFVMQIRLGLLGCGFVGLCLVRQLMHGIVW